MQITFLFILLSFLFSQDHSHDHGNKSFKAGSFKGEIIDSSNNSPLNLLR